jgi:hypothetical protein
MMSIGTVLFRIFAERTEKMHYRKNRQALIESAAFWVREM